MSMLADHYANRPISNRRGLRARLTRSEAKRVGSPGRNAVRFRLQYLGWRSTSLGLGELTPGSCGNAFGVKNRTAGLNQITTCETNEGCSWARQSSRRCAPPRFRNTSVMSGDIRYDMCFLEAVLNSKFFGVDYGHLSLSELAGQNKRETRSQTVKVEP